MSLTCDEVLEIVSAGDEGAEGRPDFVAHLGECARCRLDAPPLLEAARAIRAAPAEVLSGHPTSDLIVALALGSGDAGPGPDPGAAEHAAVCAVCAAEVQEVRRAEQARRKTLLGTASLFEGLRNWIIKLAGGAVVPRVAWAASVLGLLILAYPAFLGLRRLPPVQEELASLKQRTSRLEGEIRGLSVTLAEARGALDRLSRWSGPLRLLALTSPMRGQTARQVIDIDPNEPYVLVSVRPILREQTLESDGYRFVIVDVDDKTAWSSVLTAAEIRRQMQSSGALIFPIPSGDLAPGRHELRVLPEREPHEPILEIPFEIVPAR